MAKAHDAGRLALIRCQWCNVSRYYRPDDLMKLVPFDLMIDQVEGKMRCDGCGRRDYISARVVYLTAAERVGVKLRRLVKIKTIRIPIWKDEEA